MFPRRFFVGEFNSREGKEHAVSPAPVAHNHPELGDLKSLGARLFYDHRIDKSTKSAWWVKAKVLLEDDDVTRTLNFLLDEEHDESWVLSYLLVDALTPERLYQVTAERVVVI